MLRCPRTYSGRPSVRLGGSVCAAATVGVHSYHGRCAQLRRSMCTVGCFTDSHGRPPRRCYFGSRGVRCARWVRVILAEWGGPERQRVDDRGDISGPGSRYRAANGCTRSVIPVSRVSALLGFLVTHTAEHQLIKSPLLSSTIPRYYLRLHARTSEDMPLTCKRSYRIMTAAASPYRGIRATTEQPSTCIGLDHYE